MEVWGGVREVGFFEVVEVGACGGVGVGVV